MPVLIPGLITSPTPGAFPDTDLELTCEAAFGADVTTDPATWEFTDLSDRLTANPITIQWGVLVGAGNPGSGSASVQLLNDDGYLTAHHPASPWWPYVDKGTPLRLSVRPRTATIFTDRFDRVAGPGLGTATSGQTYAGGTASAFAVNGSAGTISPGAANAFRHTRAAVDHRDVDVTLDVAVDRVAAGVANVFGPTLRGNSGGTNYVWPEVEFGLGGIVQLTVRTAQGGVFTGHAQITQPGLTYTAGTVVRCRAVLIGGWLRMKAWLAAGTEPAGWTVDVTLDLSGLTLSDTHFGLAGWVPAGNTNSPTAVFTIDNVVVVPPAYPRFEGYIADVKTVFVPTAGGTVHSVAQIDAGGVGTILERRGADAWSPMRRSLQYADITPIDYWPLEDQEGSTSAASAFPDRPAMTVTGPAVFAFDTEEPEDLLLARYGTKNLVSVAAGAKLSATVQTSTSASGWTVSVYTNVSTRDVSPAVSEIRILEWATPSSTDWTRWALICTSTGHAVRAYNDSTSTSTTVVNYANDFLGMIFFDVEAAQDGANIDVTLYLNANPFGAGTTAGTMAPVTRITVNPDRANVTASTSPYGLRYQVGHVQVRDVAAGAALPFYSDDGVYHADEGWYEEPTHLRVARIAEEARVPFRQVAEPDAELWTRLNTQQEGGTVDLASAAVDAESGGILYETGFGWGLVPRASRYNRPVDLTVDLATYARSEGTGQDEVLQPHLDVGAANVWAVERTSGGSRSYAAPAGYRQRRGTVADKATLDLLYDEDAGPHAQWRVHMGVDGRGAHYPQMSLDLAANPDLIDDWLVCRPGSRVQRLNQPTVAGLDTIDQVIDTASETISPRSWIAEVATSPAVVWQVGVFDDTSGGSLLDAATTTVGVDLDAVDTSVVFSSTDRFDVWETVAVGYLVDVGPEVMQVTAMGAQSGSGPWTQTATVVRGVNGVTRAHAAGTEIHVSRPLRPAL